MFCKIKIHRIAIWIVPVLQIFVLAVHGTKFYSAIECSRECVEGQPARICYYKFTLEQYSVLSLACNNCTPTSLNQFFGKCECITADGVERMLLTANRMLPGPSIQVCQYDKVVVDVENLMPGYSTTIHWHGIKQRGTPYYDGVPMVTQCPIEEATTFRYQWIAENEGTHYWHSHSGLQRLDGLFGSIIVRQPKSVDIHGHLYDFDLKTHVMIISDWYHQLALDSFPGTVKNSPGQTAKNLLINGKGFYVNPTFKNETDSPMEVFTVKPGRVYRFRIINGMSSVCTSVLTIEGHTLTLIATDGGPVQPIEVNSIKSASGERYDFLLTADAEVKSYWIQVRGLEECDETQAQQFAILRYAGTDPSSMSRRPTYKKPLDNGTVANSYDGVCHGEKKNAICISELNSAKPLDFELLPWEKPEKTIYMPFQIIQYNNNEVFELGKRQPNLYLVAPDSRPYGSLVNNITYIPAPSPLLSQYNDIDPKLICSPNKKPARCKGKKCSCTQVIQIDLDSMVELILIDASGDDLMYHPFHMHGHSFNVLAVGVAQDLNATKITYDVVKRADEQGLLVRKYKSLPSKDTIIVPQNGYAVVRFRADNPGFWLFHCHFELHLAIGMGVVFQVGNQTDLAPVPPDFPKCKNFQPSILENLTVVY